MKLKFNVEYTTEWGQLLCVTMHYISSDGTRRTQRLPMQTADGQHWQVETSVVESRQHPVVHISYYYQVENQEGQVLRKEWTMVERCFHFDSAKNYSFADQWKDRPLNSHLYTSACQLTGGFRTDGLASPLRMPLYRKTVLFRVSAPQLTKGQTLALIGSHPALGAWSAARYLLMEYVGQGEWMLSVNVDAVQLPIEYKYVVVAEDTHELLCWEEGDNRIVEGNVADGEVLVLSREPLRLAEKTWRAAGVVVPVFALRSEHSYGVGDFGDVRRLVDWVAATGMKVIQLLPVNDTTTDGNWHDSHPYNIVSAFALHPHYLDIEALGVLKDKKRMTVYRRRQRELNAQAETDYEAVGRVKRDYVEECFRENGSALLRSKEFLAWMDKNKAWLEPYARWRCECGETGSMPAELIYYVQYHLHLQLKAASDYAHAKGVMLKGDLPVGVNRMSAETTLHPEYFNLKAQAGAPPDASSPMGQNWGFPTYNWKEPQLAKWFHERMVWMGQYFDALRIDHILGFFRTWEIPVHAIDSKLGHFSPALPFTAEEIEYFGLHFRKNLLTHPFINSQVLNRLFGVHADYVKDSFLVTQPYGFYELKSDFDTQQKVRAFFEGQNDENSQWIREGLYRLVENVLFIEDESQPGMYHPRIGAFHEPVYDALSAEEKDAFMRLYNNYFYERHNFYWGNEAIRRLSDVMGDTHMLLCGEDLGMLPQCVVPVLDQLRILTLEIQTMPKRQGQEFGYLNANPYRSVCTISTHDMPPLRLWWLTSPECTQRYYVAMLQKSGRAPEQLPAHLAEEIIARHLYCPSMLCLLSLQDWLSMDGELRSKNPRSERINVPNEPYNKWQWRMHLSVEQLIDATRFNNKVRTMITLSKR